QDGREVYRDGEILCKACAGGGYYSTVGSCSSVERYAKKK
ncbi:MAG: hypothetical protein H6R44_284, partial [Nitrospirae bacterium]|nr:hypothetical protein [Nitrospirota bacterium]